MTFQINLEKERYFLRKGKTKLYYSDLDVHIIKSWLMVRI